MQIVDRIGLIGVKQVVYSSLETRPSGAKLHTQLNYAYTKIKNDYFIYTRSLISNVHGFDYFSICNLNLLRGN